jgi:cytoskeletal protein RodZ
MKQLHFQTERKVSAVETRFAKRALSRLAGALIIAAIVIAIVGVGLLVVHNPQTQATNSVQSSPSNSSPTSDPSPGSGSSLMGQPGGEGNSTGVCDDTTNYYYYYYC